MSTNVSPLAGHAPREVSFKAIRIGAWVSTGLFCAVMSLSGVLFLAGARPVVEAMAALGYPPYFARMLGAAKLLGVAALVAPRASTLREWAYAGFAFDLVAAVISHLATGGASHAPPPLLILGVLATSYVLRRRLAQASA
jgi:hypothetical protein